MQFSNVGQAHLKCSSQMFQEGIQGSFKEVSRGFRGSLKIMSSMFQGSSGRVSSEFQGSSLGHCFKGIFSEVTRVFRKVSIMIEKCIKILLLRI